MATQTPPPNRPQRIHLVDWLRGVAVVFMILAHGIDAWLIPAAKVGPVYEIIKVASGIPARLFLLLVGVSAAIQFDSSLRKGLPMTGLRNALAKRGVMILGLAYVFRVQQWVLSRFYGGMETLFRVDILNAIGACMILVALLATPRNGKRQILAALVGAAVFLSLGTTIGPAVFPAWIPRPISSYIGGQRPMAWFSLFPWAAWALVGVPIGHLWVWVHEQPTRLRTCFRWTIGVGASLVLGVTLIRYINPAIIRYPNAVVMQMGPGIFFHRLGIIALLAGAGYFWRRTTGPRFSVLGQLGKTSLLIYWVHIELCYGRLVYNFREKLPLAPALALVLLLTTLMFGVSLARTHALPRAWNWAHDRHVPRSPADRERR